MGLARLREEERLEVAKKSKRKRLVGRVDKKMLEKKYKKRKE